MNTNEKNINEEVLEEVSGGVPIINETYHDKNGNEHNKHSSNFSGAVQNHP